MFLLRQKCIIVILLGFNDNKSEAEIFLGIHIFCSGGSFQRYIQGVPKK